MAHFLLLSSLIFFSLFSISSSTLPPETVMNAAEILKDSGFISMSLTLQIVAETLISQSSSATIFSPSDAAFSVMGRPSMSLIQYHISPVIFSVESLRSLPIGTKVSTLFPNNSLIVTASGSDSHISLNNVKIIGSPIYDDGFLVIFGIDEFFDPSFQVSSIFAAPAQSPTSSGIRCSADTFSGVNKLSAVSDLLKSRNYSVMASFLDLQLRGFGNQTELTVFAPLDDAVKGILGNFSEYPAFFHRHVLPCRFAWSDLVTFDDGTTLNTSLEGYTINVTRSGITLVLNGIPVIFPDLYCSDSLAVHGLPQVFTEPTKQEPTTTSSLFSGCNSNDTE